MKKTSQTLFYLFLALGFSLLVNVTTARASHLLGGDITYQYIDSNKYDFFLTLYRDCAQVAIPNPSNRTKLICNSSGKTAGVQLSLVAINDLTPICGSQKPPCTANKAGSAGVEELVYKVRINFSDSIYKFLISCGEIRFETTLSSRSNYITTGIRGNLYLFASLNLSGGYNNSSPIIEQNPSVKICGNRGVKIPFIASDSIDSDSLSFHRVAPWKAFNSAISFSSGYSFYEPFKYYGTTTNPKANPPTGFYFNDQTGECIFTPTRFYEVSVITIEVREWRKDSSGKYEQISSIRRDMTYQVENCGNNNAPQITGPRKSEVCQGDTIMFTIGTVDNDSIDLSWSGGVGGMKFELEDSTAKLPKINFSWVPHAGYIGTLPYNFLIWAYDRHCPEMLRMRTVAGFSVYVRDPKKQAKAKIVTKNVGCGAFQISPDEKEYTSRFRWDILDSVGQLLADTLFDFKLGGNSSYSVLESNTVQFKHEGTYIIRLHLESDTGCMNTIYDTLKADFKSRLFKSDLVFCNTAFLKQNIVDTYYCSGYFWNQDTISSLSLLVKGQVGSKIHTLRVVCKNGWTILDSLDVFVKKSPELQPIRDTSLCVPFSYPVSPVNIWDTANVSTKYKWDNNSKDTVQTKIFTTSGWHRVRATNSCGNKTIDFRIFELPSPEVTLRADTSLCVGDSVWLSPIISPKDATFIWDDGDTSKLKIAYPGQTFIIRVGTVCDTISDTIEVAKVHVPAPEFNYNMNDTVVTCDVINPNGKYEYNWEMGDSGTEVGRSINHTYSIDSTYKVCVQSKDTVEGCVSDYYCDSLAVGSCDASFYPVLDSSTKYSVYIVDQSTGNNLSYLWDFGDGDTSHSSKPQHKYDTFGKYNLCLRIETVKCISTFCDTLGMDKDGNLLKVNGFWINVVDSAKLSINESTNKFIFTVSPNPANDYVYISLGKNGEDISVVIYNVDGRNISAITDKINSYIYRVDISNIPNGVYVLVVRNGNSIGFRRIIKSSEF